MMTFTQSIKRVFTQYATFSGRASRAEYWWFYLLNFAVNIIAGSLMAGAPATWETFAGLVAFLVVIYSLAAFVPGLAVAVRRLHDTNHSGWNILWGFLPIIGAFILIYLLVCKGTPGDNSYGKDPCAAGSDHPSADESTTFIH